MADTSTAATNAEAGVPADDAAAAGDEPAMIHGCRTTESRGQPVVHPTTDQYLELLRSLIGDGYHMCVDLCAVDYLAHPGRSLPEGIAPERFEVVLMLLDLEQRRRIRVRLQVPEATPNVPSAFELWPGTEAMEREAFDMFGIVFDGHPDLTRILMPEDWVGHPLRKDYAIGEIPVQFSEGHDAPPPSAEGAP
jgi:NADH-quinone oxidoreductase subunit C